MESLLFLSTRGRHSGVWRLLEVWFVQLADSYYVLSESQERPDWVKNIEANPEVRFSIGTRRNESHTRTPCQGRGRVLNEATDSELLARVRASLYCKYRWSSGTIVELAVPG